MFIFTTKTQTKAFELKDNSNKGAWIAEWSSHSTTMNLGTLRPGP